MIAKLLLLLSIAGIVLTVSGQVTHEVLSEKVDNLGTKVDNAATRVGGVEDEIDRLEDELEDVGDDIEDELDDLEAEVEDVGGAVSDVQVEVVNLRNDIERLNNEVSSLGDGGGTTGDACNTERIDQELDTLKNGQTSLQKDISSALQSLQELKDQLTDTVLQLQNTTRQLCHKVESMEYDLKDLRDGTNEDMASLKNQLQEFQGHTDSTLQDLRDQLGDTNLAMQALKDQLTSQGRQGSQERSEIKATLEAELSKVYNKVELISTKTMEHQMTTAEQLQNISREVYDLCGDERSTELIPSCRQNVGPSGHYLMASNGSAVSVYCDMERQCCGSTGGWMRVAHLDMTDPSQQCPVGFRLSTSPKRVCKSRNTGSGCSSITFPTHGVQYSKVCGQARAYQVGGPDAFEEYYHGHVTTIEEHYVYGLSVTHGSSPRKHIWTFAAAEDDLQSNSDFEVCPCTDIGSTYTGQVPPFVGTDYFCETASHQARWIPRQFYHEDPLWDGQGCGPTSSCCQFNSPPWFCKELPQPTTDDIEVRLCSRGSDEYPPIELIELYIQ